MKNLIVLNRDLYPPRRNFAFCHELAHLLLGHPQQPFIEPGIEREADRLAAELMLPEVEFRHLMSGRTFGEVREACPHASWEVVARRWVEFKPAVLTIFDNGTQTSRIAPDGLAYPPRPTPPERALIGKVYAEREHRTAKSPPLTMQAYFIDDGRGIERVILLTEIESDY